MTLSDEKIAEMLAAPTAWRHRGPKGGWITTEEKQPWSEEALYGNATIETLAAELSSSREQIQTAWEALKALDDYWTDALPGGPEGSRVVMSGLGTISEDTIEIWRKVRRARSTLSPENSHGE